MSVIMGLDLCLTSVGLAGVGWTSTITEKKRSKKGQVDSVFERYSRIDAIKSKVICECLAGRVDRVFLEAPSFGSKFGMAHDRSGLWWCVVSELFANGIAVTEVSPITLKKFILGAKSDRGDDGSKGSIRAELARRLPEYAPANDDEADALVLLMIGHELLGSPLVKMPAVNTNYLKAVKL